MDTREPVEPEQPALHVLHLDDDPVWRERAAHILAREGILAESGPGLPELWNRLATGIFSIVITECVTSAIRVQDLLEGLALRAITVPVAILSSREDPSLALAATGLGTVFVIRKSDVDGPGERRFAAAVRRAGERHREAEEIRRKAGIYEAILQAAPMGMCIVQDHKVLWCNIRMHQVLGFTDGELFGIDTAHLIGSEAEHSRIDSGLFEPGPSGWGAVEGDLRRKDGTIVPCQIFARPLNPDKPSEGHIIIGRETGEFEQMKRLLHLSESRVNDLIDNANSIILRVDRKGVIRFINPYGEKFFGFSSDELLGKQLLDTIVPHRSRSGRDLAGMIHEVLENPDDFEVNVNENIKKNGERVWIAWTNKPIIDDKGTITEILSIGNDISDRKIDVVDAALALAPWKAVILKDTDIEGTVFQAVFNIALEISREGREGKAVGTTFLVGDAKNVLGHSRQLILNPFEGHRAEIRVITNPELHETIKELSQLDGAFVISGQGLVEAAGRYITIDTSTASIPKGFGTRHASVAGITQMTKAVGIVVSQSGGRISIFKNGRLLRVFTPAE
ncbi:MAG: PAS domain S-box protein [Methanomicrobiales archaeon]|nr:PAS domain S-box protein [Methanomicrobiales archaeon]